MEFTIQLAGIRVAVRSLYDEVGELCADYRCDGSPADFSVEILPEHIERERLYAEREALMEGAPCLSFTAPYLETLAVYRKIADRLCAYDALLMHGAVVALDGRAYLFTAPSGTGKTTHTGFWLARFPDAYMLNGDKPILRFREGRLFACGTPWSGKEHQDRNEELPLAAICVLERGAENRIRGASFRELYPLLLQQTYRPPEREAMTETLRLFKKLSGAVCFHVLQCNLDPDAARVAWEGMRHDN